MWDKILQTISNAFSSMALTSDDIFNIIFSLFVAVMIGFIISQAYKLTHRGVNYELTFMTSLILLAPIVAMVMFFIRGNLVLSLGLVGSLSIIRFRTPIKDTRDMIYLFWSITVGLGAGTFNWGVVALSSLVILITVMILYFIKYGRGQSQDFILVITGHSEFQRDPVQEIIEKYCSDVKIRSQTINEDIWEIVYELHLGEKELPIDDMLPALKGIQSVQNVSLLAPQLALPT